MTVAGASNLNSTLTVAGASNLNSTLTVAGASNLNSTLTVAGASNLNSTLTVAGISTLNNKLSVGSDVSLNGVISLSYTSMPTYGPSNIGFVIVGTNVGIINVANAYSTISTFSNVPIGVWLLNIHFVMSSAMEYGGSYYISPTNNSNANAIATISYTSGQGYNMYTVSYCFTNTSLRNLYFVVNSGGSSISVRDTAYSQLVRIA